MQTGATRRLHRNIPQSYSGTYLNSMPHGYGSLALPNEAYTGHFKLGLRDGFGEEVSENYAFRGFFKHDAPEGDGVLLVDDMRVRGDFGANFESDNATCVLATGESLSGQFNRNHFQGNGTVMALGEFYKGQIVNNQYNGRGVLTAPDFQYAGDFVDGLRQGFGEESRSGEYYKGCFKADKRHGQGTLVTQDYRFDGEFSGGLKARGRVVYRDHSVYEGTFEHDQRSGTGRLTVPQHATFDGQFAHDEIISGTIQKRDYCYKGEIKGFKPSGKGQLTTGAGVYQGTFESGVLTGLATFENDVVRYQGEFNAKFEFHGKGRLYYKAKDGTLRGSFCNGKAHGKCTYEDRFEYFEGFYQHGTRQGSGILRESGTQYTGEFASGRKSGRGIEITENGDVFQGMFKNDEKVQGILQSSSRSPDRAVNPRRVELVEFDDGEPLSGESVFRRTKSFRDVSFSSRPNSAAVPESCAQSTLCLTATGLRKSQSIARGMTKTWRREKTPFAE